MINRFFLLILLITSSVSVGIGYYIGISNSNKKNSESNLDEAHGKIELSLEKENIVGNRDIEDIEEKQNTDSTENENDISSLDKIADSVIVRLKELKFFEADLETERFFFGVLEKDFITSDDIQNFDCEQLEKINNIWLNYTGGKLGFSRIENVFTTLYLRSLYEKQLAADVDDQESVSIAVFGSFGSQNRSLYGYVKSATGSEYGALSGSFENRKEPIYISAVFPNLTDPGMEKFYLMNDRLESCGLIEMDHKSIRKQIVDTHEDNNYTSFLSEIADYKKRFQEHVTSTEETRRSYSEGGNTGLRTRLPWVEEPPTPHPWFEEFYEIEAIAGVE